MSKRIPRGISPYPVSAVLLILVLAVYWQVGGHSFVSFDDGEYVYENPPVQRGWSKEGIYWAFTTFHAANWHPVTWLSHMADVDVFGLDAGWHHRMNVLLHLANTVLLFLVLRRMTGGVCRSAFVAALFAVHPLHVESVAWVAERKDVLSTLFWLLTMAAYHRYVRRPDVGRYLLVMGFFALGLMSKPMLVTLPFVLLLLDWWPLGRMSPEGSTETPPWPLSMPMVSRRLYEKVPLLGLSAMSCIVTYMAQARGGAVTSLENVPLGSRVSNALVSYAAYLGKTAWPASLAVYYPHPASIHAVLPAWEVAGAVLLLCGVTLLVLREGPRRPYLAVGWLWYLGTMVPVIGWVQVGAAAYADRYTYVPLIGVFLAVSWGIPGLLGGFRYRRLALWMSGCAVVAMFSLAAWFQVGYWRNSVTLFSRALAVTERNWMALTSMGLACDELGNPREAIDYYREALRVKPEYAHAWYNLGVATGKLGRLQEAIVYYREALRIQPNYPAAHHNQGLAYARLGQFREAIASFREALRIQPEYVGALYNLGLAYARLGQFPEAIASFREALRIQPEYAAASFNAGVAYARLGRFREAIASFQDTIRAAPGYAEAWNNLGLAYEELGQPEQAVACYREAQRIRGKPIEPTPLSSIRKKDLPGGARSVDSHGGP